MFQPSFKISNKILNYISQIEAAKQIISNSPLLPYYERKFHNDALLRSIHHSTHIEGNQFDIDEAEKIIKGEAIEKQGKERDFQDIINYRNVLKYIETIQDISLNINHIYKVHELVSSNLINAEYCGVLRKQQVVIKNSQTGHVSYIPPSYLEIESLLKDLLTWLDTEKEKDMHSVIRVGIFHCQFVKIHPFVDGNGRTARALSTLLLYFDGYDIKRFFCLDEYYDSNLKEYYSALQSVTTYNNDYTKWLEYFAKGLLDEFTLVKEKVLKISRDQKLKNTIGQIYLSERQEKLIEYIQEIGRLQNSDFPKILPEISEDTVLRELKVLLKKKVIRKKGKTKAAFYELRN